MAAELPAGVNVVHCQQLNPKCKSDSTVAVLAPAPDLHPVYIEYKDIILSQLHLQQLN